LGLIGQLDGVFGIAGVDHGSGGSEGLFAEHRHLVRHLCHDSWLVEVAFAWYRLTAEQHARARLDRFVHLLFQGVAQVAASYRPDLRITLQRVAHL